MGDAVLSAFSEVIISILLNLLLAELRSQRGLRKELRNLMTTVQMIQAVIADVEEREQKENAVQLWLDELRDVAYAAIDVLDEVATESQRQQLIPHAQVRNSLSVVNPKRFQFSHGISNKIKEIEQRLEFIGKRQHELGLRRPDVSRHHGEGSELLQTTSMNSTDALGREHDKQRIVERLISSDGVVEAGISVLPVLGMGGLGKTTLAQLVYNDEIVEKHFELRLWVHVSHDFNVVKLSKAIIESIDSLVCDSTNLDALQKHLHKKLNGRRYLLVLDDVWNESLQEWKRLRAPLLSGAKGSKILVTTRIKEVADMMGTPTYILHGLSDDDCWSLFCQYAMGQNTHASRLDKIGKEIVKKCKGLPLAAIAMGHRLHKVTDRSKWETILQNERWEFSGENGDISRAVGSSYRQLPAHLKPCFAYCSIIPKGFVFEKEFIVQLWMAQNFIQPRGGERIEDIGSSYFDSLVQRSFFQLSHFDYKSGQPRYTMHDLIHDYGQHVSAGDCCTMELGKQYNFSEKIRHLSLIYDQFARNDSRHSRSSNQRRIFDTLYRFKGLYTLLLVRDSTSNSFIIPDNFAEKLGSLRTLDLSNSGLSVLPQSIGDLKHLRCLQLRNTNITRLPESVGCLYNLQTLGLRNCCYLEELPVRMKNLRKLRHLDLHLDDDSMMMAQEAMPRTHRLRSMPPEMGLLSDLQTLPRFIVSTKASCGVSELQDLNDIHGELFISNLQLVRSAEEAAKADLASKQYIQKLELRWSYAMGVGQHVLAGLQPHTNLKELAVVGYDGTAFPSWIGSSSFSNLVTLRLSDCKNCETLPPLGRLPMLRDLYIKGMDRVQLVNCAFCGGHGNRSFPSLQKLHFESMHGLQVWDGNDGCELRCLRELVFKDCIDLRQLIHNLPSLKILRIEGSPWLIGLPRFPSLHSLEVRVSGDWIWESWRCLASLSSLTLRWLPTSTFPSGLLSRHASLRRLEISHLDQLLSLPDDGLPRGLVYFGIKHCPQLNSLPNGLRDLEALEELEIHDCEQLTHLPGGLKNLNSLIRLEISDCPRLQSLPTDGLPPSVQFLSINNHPNLH
ncbi:Disease resistance protein RGA3 [Cocos nucifera]|uniref:Disease resistance protein RGA3 n=1 Tax=Cocos nucifera TaxID=13894 RepID=A0A8K0IF73_COCNU|nr:Disease resistance protein RGA3 [Cocos nucifera]